MRRKKRILAAKVKPEANEIHEDDTDVCKIAQSQHNKYESEGDIHQNRPEQRRGMDPREKKNKNGWMGKQKGRVCQWTDKYGYGKRHTPVRSTAPQCR
jgi:hypothetical protein